MKKAPEFGNVIQKKKLKNKTQQKCHTVLLDAGKLFRRKFHLPIGKISLRIWPNMHMHIIHNAVFLQ